MLRKIRVIIAVAVIVISGTMITWNVNDFMDETKKEAEAAYFDERLDLDDLPVDVMKTLQPDNYIGCRVVTDEHYDEIGIHQVVRSAYYVGDQTDEWNVIEFLSDPETEKIVGWELFNHTPTGTYTIPSED